ncbi:MAG: sugar ABC transporter ATP-binding protein [Firmicutes bacterium]|nr:sugar ABC transporter ATP-binding protein [Bacillota bacterium]
MAADYVLEIENVSKSFPGVRALDGVSISIQQGECHCLVGQNGAGKSTLIKILAGAYSMDSGTLKLNGTKVSFSSPHQALKMGISVLYQELALNPHFDAVENIFMGREIGSRWGVVNYRRMRREAERLIRPFGVPLDLTRKVGEMSVAHQQIVALAKALSFEAKVVVFDEPSAVLTAEELNRLFSIVSQLKASGVTVIYISHRLEEIFRVGDRVTVLRDGRVVGTQSVSDVTQPELVRMMIGREVETEFPDREKHAAGTFLEVRDIIAPGLGDGISLGVGRGEVVGIFGLVGSGRTELAHALAGVTRKQHGTILLDGKALRIDTPAHGIRHGIGLLPENRKEEGLVLPMSVQENVTLPILGRLQKWGFLKRGDARQTAGEYVEKLAIKTPRVEHPVKNLSGGNQQKVVLAKWLAARCRLLILDEPTRGVDVGAKMDIYQLILDAAREGLSVIMISSELPEIMALSDRVLVMRYGRVVGEYDPATVDQETILARAMGVA